MTEEHDPRDEGAQSQEEDIGTLIREAVQAKREAQDHRWRARLFGATERKDSNDG